MQSTMIRALIILFSLYYCLVAFQNFLKHPIDIGDLIEQTREQVRMANTALPAGPTISIIPGNTPIFTAMELYNMTTTLLDALTYPNNAHLAEKGNSTLFAPNATIHVGSYTFKGRELATEYAFGLLSHTYPNTDKFFTLLAKPMPFEYTIVGFTGYNDTAAVWASFNMYIRDDDRLVATSALMEKVALDVRIWLTFTADGQISNMEPYFPSLASLLTHKYKLDNKNTVADLTGLIAESICEVADTFCKGANKQYDNLDACYDFLTENVRFGKIYELGNDTLLCRMVQQSIIGFRPEAHCPLLGPGGGGIVR